MKSYEEQYYEVSCSFYLFYHVTDCNQVTNTKSCTLLPNCVACLLTYTGLQQMDYFIRLFSDEPSDEIRFVSFSQPSTYVLSCNQGTDVESCSAIVEYVEANEEILLGQSIGSLLYNFFTIVELVLLLLMIIFLLLEWRRYRRMRAMEREMWHLYEENYSEYREIVNVMHEEDSIVFNKHVIEDVSGDAALIQTS